LDVATLTWHDLFVVSLVIIVVETVVAVSYSAPLVFYRHKVNTSFLEGMRIFSSIVIIGVGLYIGYTALPAEDLKAVF